MRISRKDFLRLMATSVCGVCGAMAGGALRPLAALAADPPPSPGAAARRPRPLGSRTLIRGASVLTMDPALGDIENADVLIESDRIVAVGGRIEGVQADIIDATGMILMPGMMDGHRHVWQTLIRGAVTRTSGINYFREVHLRMSVSFRPEDAYLSSYLGGLDAIDSGVTRVVDHFHISNIDREIGDAAARGLKDSGVGGYFCYQLGGTHRHRPGDRVTAAEAFGHSFEAASAYRIDTAAQLRDRHFSSSSDPLQFGVALTAAEFGRRTPEITQDEFRMARKLSPKLMTQHLYGQEPADAARIGLPYPTGLPPGYRVIPDIHRAGLLGSDYLISHGTQFTDEELRMIRDGGARIATTPIGEMTYPRPPLHGRARALGIPIVFGLDNLAAFSNDYFEVIRRGFFSLTKDSRDFAVARTMRARDFINLATLGGARALNIDSLAGSVTPGKQADLVLLRADGLNMPPTGDLAERVMHYAGIHNIDSVWVAGRLLKHAGRLVGLDWAQTRPKMLAAREHVMTQAKRIEIVAN